ncbi:MAG: hypothetical protein GX825_02070, partial [Syntrophomonadaceae bacterium]|nr:hypothetical protein [Syntrophomonadaceae bacterium]
VNTALGLKEKTPINYEDVKDGDWFASEIAKAKKSGYITGYPDNTIRPNSMITREEIAVILANIMKLEPDAAGINKFVDFAEVSAWSRGSSGVIVTEGIISGFPDGTFRPTQIATRAEAVAILSKAAGILFRESSIHELKSQKNNVTVTSSEITLKDGIIEGSLFLTEGIGEGSITLENITVKGRTLISGGGTNSITFKNCTLGTLVISKTGSPVRVIASGNTSILKTIANTDAILENSNNADPGFDFNNLVAQQGVKITINDNRQPAQPPATRSSGGSSGGSSYIPRDSIRPIIFVHGNVGSAAQFEAQAMRFANNGYTHDQIFVFEYDTTKFSGKTVDPSSIAAFRSGLDKVVNTAKQSANTDQVEIVAHSLGTILTQGYLNSSPERAANVAHYVNFDGFPAESLPGGVSTTAIWAEIGTPGREIVGANNVILPNQTHVEVATSPESFIELYKFFTGKPPTTSDIVPESGDSVNLAGRVIVFPINTGPTGSSLNIWEVNGSTGYRTGDQPAATYQIGADGSWGPFAGKKGEYYEFELIRDNDSNHNEYYFFEPFIQSDYLIRLVTSFEPGVGLAASMDKSEDQVNLIIGRNMEFWGDEPGHNDTLEINVTNIISAATHPISQRVNYTYVYDKGADDVNDLDTPIATYFAMPFFTGVDFNINGANPPDGTTSIVLTSRKGDGKQQIINIPNRASDSVTRMQVQFHDYIQEIQTKFLSLPLAS